MQQKKVPNAKKLSIQEIKIFCCGILVSSKLQFLVETNQRKVKKILLIFTPTDEVGFFHTVCTNSLHIGCILYFGKENDNEKDLFR